MKKVVIEVPKDKSDTIQSKFKDTLFSVDEREKSTRFTLYIPDEMLDQLIRQTNGSIKETSDVRPFWTGIIPDYENLAKEDDRITLIEVSTPDFVISPFVEKLKERSVNSGRKEDKTPIEEIIATTESSVEFDQKKFFLAAIAGALELHAVRDGGAAARRSCGAGGDVRNRAKEFVQRHPHLPWGGGKPREFAGSTVDFGQHHGTDRSPACADSVKTVPLARLDKDGRKQLLGGSNSGVCGR